MKIHVELERSVEVHGRIQMLEFAVVSPLLYLLTRVAYRYSQQARPNSASELLPPVGMITVQILLIVIAIMVAGILVFGGSQYGSFRLGLVAPNFSKGMKAQVRKETLLRPFPPLFSSGFWILLLVFILGPFLVDGVFAIFGVANGWGWLAWMVYLIMPVYLVLSHLIIYQEPEGDHEEE